MTSDTGCHYGSKRPGAVFRALVAGAQRAPRNALGRHLAHALRSMVIACASLPLDLEVGLIRMRCHFRDNHSEKKFVFTPWRYDTEELELLLQKLSPDGTFVDIGANVGIYTLTAALHLDRGGRIVAVEPNPEMFRRLQFNVAATRAGNARWPTIHLLPLGISDVTGHFDLHLEGDNLGGSSIIDQGQGGHSIRIECRPLATVLQDCGIERIDVLKIDIEGAEDRALLPYLEQAPSSALPRSIIIERSEHRWQCDLTGAMTARGYRCALRTRLNSILSRDEPIS